MEETEIREILKNHILGITSTGRTSQGVLDHSLLRLLNKAALTQEQLKQFADIRYNAASRFERMLERAHQLAEADPLKKELAVELKANLDDERGLGRASGKGAHSEWRRDFLHAIGVSVHEKNEIPLYAFNQKDDLPTLAGVLLAAEYTIPSEDSRVLKSMRKALPETFTTELAPDEGTPAQLRNTLYLQDHIRHDAQQHLPDLMRAATHCLHGPDEQTRLITGIERFAADRKNLYDAIQRKLGIDSPIPESRQHGR